MLREILLRLPPQPSSLPRAAAVCKRWRGLVADPRFVRLFYAHHRKPPLLAVFEQNSSLDIVFHPILDPPDRVAAVRISPGNYDILSCRHGLVLVRDWEQQDELVVCDPVTSEQRHVALPPGFRSGFFCGEVLCAAGDQGHVHGGCHSTPFKVVLVATFNMINPQLACVYSSDTGIWDNVNLAEPSFEFFGKPAVLVDNCLYWLSLNDDIFELNLGERSLTVIIAPPVTEAVLCENCQIIQAEHGAVGYATLSETRFQMWQRNISGHGVATWVLWKTTEINTIIQLPSPHVETDEVQLLGYDEDDVVFLRYRESVYMVQLNSMQSRKLDGIHSEERQYYPFKSFFTQGAAIAGGLNGAEMLEI